MRSAVGRTLNPNTSDLLEHAGEVINNPNSTVRDQAATIATTIVIAPITVVMDICFQIAALITVITAIALGILAGGIALALGASIPIAVAIGAAIMACPISAYGLYRLVETIRNGHC